ncbi:ATP dependent DNA ligase [Streptomyces mirabilis]|uniref:ATP dependent DNA ligase n=1 Tax=Streptomyces mirabilis TaxID=68239 RepID=UPI0036E32197
MVYCNSRIPTLPQCRRDTTEGIIGGITGTLIRPQTLLLGRYDRDGSLRLVARSTQLHPDPARHLAERMTAAVHGHPWDGVRFTASWGARTPLNVVLVEPHLVAEIDVDTAQDRGAWRHPVRFVRQREDMAPGDIAAFGEGTRQPPGDRRL